MILAAAAGRLMHHRICTTQQSLAGLPEQTQAKRCLQGKAGAQRVADNAVPATKRFNEEQLKPGADRAGEGLKTGAGRASQGLQNAADQVSQQAG